MRRRVLALMAMAAGAMSDASVVHATGADKPSGAAAATPSSAAAPVPVAVPTASPQRQVADLIVQLEAEAKKVGVAPATIRAVLANLEREPEVTALAAAQTEHERTPGQYLGLLVTPERIALGQKAFAEHSRTLEAIEARFGVDRHVLTALWGVETRFGSSPGTRPVVRALATLALDDPRRPEFWRTELLHALRIVERGDIALDAMRGSWAGAIGHTQFMPSTFNRFAVDFDGDGRRDLIGSIPDALASAAAYLAHSGWQRGETWGFEVRLPEGFDYALSTPTPTRPLAFWRDRGVARVDGGGWASTGGLEHRLLLPAGASGPAFLVNRNFGALLRYNPAIPYALAVAHLGDRLAGRGAIVAAWPPDPPMPRADRQEMQERLTRRGLDTGGVDGIIGGLTRNAIRAYQKSLGLPEDGHPSPMLLERLRAGP